MKVVIVKQNRKWGERYYAYRKGLLSRLGIFCLWNKIGLGDANTPEECLKNAKYNLQPDPPLNSKVVAIIEI